MIDDDELCSVKDLSLVGVFCLNVHQRVELDTVIFILYAFHLCALGLMPRLPPEKVMHDVTHPTCATISLPARS